MTMQQLAGYPPMGITTDFVFPALIKTIYFSGKTTDYGLRGN